MADSIETSPDMASEIRRGVSVSLDLIVSEDVPEAIRKQFDPVLKGISLNSKALEITILSFEDPEAAARKTQELFLSELFRAGLLDEYTDLITDYNEGRIDIDVDPERKKIIDTFTTAIADAIAEFSATLVVGILDYLSNEIRNRLEDIAQSRDSGIVDRAELIWARDWVDMSRVGTAPERLPEAEPQERLLAIVANASLEYSITIYDQLGIGPEADSLVGEGIIEADVFRGLLSVDIGKLGEVANGIPSTTAHAEIRGYLQDLLNDNPDEFKPDSGFFSKANSSDPFETWVLVRDSGGDLVGSDGRVLVFGGGFTDNIAGSDKDDVVFAAGFGDFIFGNGGEDVLYGEGGADTIFGDDSTAPTEGDNDYISGGADDDLIYAGGGNDIIFGGAGDDIFKAGPGDDVFAGGQPGILREEDGIDTVTYSTKDEEDEDEDDDFAAKVDNGVEIVVFDDMIEAVDDGFGNVDTLISIEKIIGSEEADTLKVRALVAEIVDPIEVIDLADNPEDEGDRLEFPDLPPGPVENSGVIVDLGIGEDAGLIRYNGGGAGVLMIKNIEDVVGTPFGDIINGNDADNILEGGKDPVTGEDDGRADSLNGRGGADTYYIGNFDSVVVDDEDKAVFLNGTQLMGGSGRGSTFTGANGETYFLLGGNLTVRESSGGGPVRIEFFKNGRAGIKLRDSGPKDDKKGAQDKGSPLVLDLDGDGLELIDLASSSAFFDFDRDGFAERTGWVAGDDGFLAIDRDGDGTIRDIGELFGANPTTLSGGVDLSNAGVVSAFAQLAAFDSDGDGDVDIDDLDFGDLLIWRDLNGDGISDAAELESLLDLGIERIGLEFDRPATSVGQNVVFDVGEFTWTGGATGEIADVFFSIDQFDTLERIADLEIPEDVQGLPFLIGSGVVSDLDVAMARDPALKEMVAELAALTPAQAHLYVSMVEQILLRWHGVEEVAADSRGEFVNGQWLAAIEAYTGTPFKQIGVTSSPRPQAGAILNESWQDYVASSAAKLLAQTPLGDTLIPGLEFALNAFLVRDDSATLSSVLEALEASSPEDPTEKIQYWNGMTRILLAFREEFSETDGDFAEAINNSLALAGVSLSFDEISRAFVGGEGDDLLIGTSSGSGAFSTVLGTDVLMGGGGDDRLAGGLGGDTYLFGQGHGSVTIEERSAIRGDRYKYFDPDDGLNNVVQFLGPITLSDLEVRFEERGPNIDLVIRILETEDELRIVDQGLGFGTKIDLFRFADGTELPYEDLLAARSGTDGDDQLFAFSGQPVDLDGGPGNDVLFGSSGDDIYRFDAGYDDDIIIERSIFETSDDRIVFGPGIDPAGVVFGRSEDPEGRDLIVTFVGLDDSLTVHDQFFYPLRPIETFEFTFGAGSILDADAVEDLLLAASDGDDELLGTNRDDILSGAAGNDRILGLEGTDLLDGGDGDDALLGGAGADVYLFGTGSGKDRIEDSGDEGNVLRFGAGITSGDLEVARSGEGLRDLSVQISGTPDVLEILGQSVEFVIDRVEFADGTFLSGRDFGLLADPVAGSAIIGTSSADDLQGDTTDDFLDGRAGDDSLAGGLGNDEYVFGRGYGADLIIDTSGVLDVVTFLPGVALQDLRFSGAADLEIRILGTDDVLTIVGGTIPGGSAAMEELRFADGTVLAQADFLPGREVGGDGDDYLYRVGTEAASFRPGAGDDLIQGTAQADSYFFSRDFGNDIIVETNSAGDRIVFEDGILQSDVEFARSGRDLVIELVATGDRLVVRDQFPAPSAFSLPQNDGVEFIEFADSTELSASQVRAQVLTPSAGDDLLIGFGTATLDGGAGDDRLEGDDGSTTYIFGRGYGDDVINDVGSSFGGEDIVRFNADVAFEDLVFRRGGDSGIDLVIEIAETGDTLTIEGSAFNRGRIEAFEFAGSGAVFAQAEFETLAASTEATDGNDEIFGFASEALLDGGAGDDVYHVGRGPSVIFFGPGSGHDLVIPDGILPNTVYKGGVIRFAPGVTVDDVEFRYAPGSVPGIPEGDLQILLNGGADRLTVVRQASLLGDIGGEGGREATIVEFRFDDAVLGEFEVSELFLTPGVATDGDDYLPDATPDGVINGGAGNDLLFAISGDETFEFGRGSGHDTIIVGGSGTLAFIGGLARADLEVSWQGDDLVFEVLDTGETITVVDAAEEPLDRVTFSDGETGFFQLLEDLAAGTSGDDVIVSPGFGPALDGGAGNDLLIGGDGDNTFVFGVGYGQDTVVETTPGEKLLTLLNEGPEPWLDIVQFASGLSLSDLIFVRTGDKFEDLAVKIAGTDDVLLIKGQLTPLPEFSGLQTPTFSDSDPLSEIPIGVDELRFVDDPGLSLTRSQIADLVTETDFSGDNTLETGDDGGTLDGGGGKDQLLGGSGNDTYVFDRGYSEDRIVDAGGGFDTIDFGDQVFQGDVAFSRVGNDGSDLLIEIGGDERLTLLIENQFSNPENRIEFFAFAEGGVQGWQDVQAAILQSERSIRDDDIVGFDTDDLLDGGAGADTLKGGRGDDFLLGGDGRDTAVFSGAQSDYSIDVQAERVIVTDLRSEGDGQDILIGIADLRFEGDGTTVNLIPENQAPLAGADSFSGVEENVVLVPLVALLQNDSDPEGQAVSLTEVANPVNGRVWINLAGDVSFEPAPDFFGEARFDYVIADPDGATATATATITIANVNDAPIAEAVTVETPEDTSIGGVVVASDVDGDSLAFALAQGPGNGSITLDAVTGAYTYTPTADFFGADSFVVKIDDGQGGTAEATVEVDVTSVNDDPVALDAAVTTVEETSVSGTITASDVDGVGFSYFVSTFAAFGGVEVDKLTGVFTYTPDADFVGEDFFEILTVDEAGGTDIARVTVIVEPGNSAPTDIALSNVSVEENALGGTVVGVLSASDADPGDTATFTLLDDADGRFTIVGDELRVADGLPLDFETAASHDVTVRVTDSGNLTFDKTIAIAVTDLNEAPIVSDQGLVIDENSVAGSVVGTVAASDPDLEAPANTLSFAITAGNEAGLFAIDAATGALSTTASLDFETGASYALTVGVTDGGTPGLGDTATVTVTVNDVNEAPTDVLLSNASVEENAETGTVVGMLSAIDPDASDVANLVLLDDADGRFRIVGDELQVANGLLIDFETATSHDVTVKVSDSGGLSIERTFSVAVGDLNETATSGDDTIFGTPGPDAIDGRSGNDTIFGRSGDDSLKGSSGNDYLQGAAGDDVLDGGSGADILKGGSGNDALDGGSGNDTLEAGEGNDMLTGASGNDSLVGGAGDDDLSGGSGNDELKGGGGADTLFGGSGSDLLSGGAGNDLLTGDSGSDTFVFADGDGNDTVADFSSNDVIDLSAFGFVGIGDLTITDGPTANDTLIQFDADDSLTLVGVNKATVTEEDFVFT